MGRRLAVAAVALAAACIQPGPRAIAYGEEVCRHCHMTVADPRFSAELVTLKGRVYVFDDIACLATFAAGATVAATDVHSLWVHDFLQPDSLLDARTAVYVRVDSLHSPMGSRLVALRAGPEAERLRARLGGRLLGWDEIERGGRGG